mmetsp:Transcript_25436/g.28447  ORF Transcript_25436/g.28447 Transcript_25436/m.28447 type:complete len:379 (-) Transcript_25436:355-1491(-)
MLSTFFFTTIAIMLVSGLEAQDGFRQIAIDTENTVLTGVVLPAICIGDFMVPKVMYTIEPADEGETDVKILTNPIDLVEVGVDKDDGLLYFKFIQKIVSEDAVDAGVIIQFPSDQLLSVNSCCSQSVQIKEGFTKFQSLTVSTNAIVNASFAVEQDSDMVVGVYTGAEANVKVTETSGAKNKQVQVIATDKAKINIDGDITSLSCNDESDCMIAGVISDPNDSRSRGRSNIQTTSCEDIDVADDSICQSRTPNVTVTVDGDLVISGVKESCVGGEDLEGLGGSGDLSSTAGAPPTTSPQPTISPQQTGPNVPTPSPTKKEKSRSPTSSPELTYQPTDVFITPPEANSDSAAFDGMKQGILNSIVGTAICGGVLLFTMR